MITIDDVWVKNSLSSSFAGFAEPENKPSTKTDVPTASQSSGDDNYK
jgi:hypothetical protein